MGRKEAVITLRLDAGLAARLDALTLAVRHDHGRLCAAVRDAGEAPGVVTRSKVARAALVRGLAELEAEKGES